MKIIDAIIFNNYWLWFHIMAGGAFAKLLNLFLSDFWSIVILSAVAILWEIYELLTSDIQIIYGSYKHFFLDSLGDILGAVIMGIIVVI